MTFSKISKVLLIMVVFVLLGLATIWATNDKESSNIAASVEDDTSLVPLVSSADYPAYIRPWLLRVINDPSASSIAEVKANIFNLRGADQDLGMSQVSLFLAFNAWESFLSSQNQYYREEAIKHLSNFAELMPDLQTEVEQLKNLVP